MTREERLLATRLLEAREQGMSIRIHLRWTAKSQVIRILLFSVYLVILARLELWLAFQLLLGLFLGAVLRDFAWWSAQKKTWKIQVKLLDWDKVHQMAEESA